jgi:hypothetical protein
MREEKVFIPSNGIQLEDFLSNHKGLLVKGTLDCLFGVDT